MDLESMSREESFQELKNAEYTKLIKPIPNHSSFKVGRYYRLEQTGNDELWVCGVESNGNITFAEGNMRFRNQHKKKKQTKRLLFSIYRERIEGRHFN